VQTLIAKIREGIKILSDDTSRSLTVKETERVDLFGARSKASGKNPELIQWESNLWLQSKETDPKRRERAWNLSILASNLLLFRESQTTEKDEISGNVPNVSAKTRLRWRDTACIINMLVLGLWPHWGNKAYLIFEAISSM